VKKSLSIGKVGSRSAGTAVAQQQVRRYRARAAGAQLRAPPRLHLPLSAMAETRHNIPPEFLDVADEFVQLANKYTDQYSRDWVRAAMMYATARFNAFAWITREDNLEQSLDAAAAYYASEYDKMLRDNVDEIEPAYRAARRAQSQ
jgi:hypothetical protein